MHVYIQSLRHTQLKTFNRVEKMNNSLNFQFYFLPIIDVVLRSQNRCSVWYFFMSS